MRRKDFQNEDYRFMDEMQLTEWVLRGDYRPIVKIYYNSRLKQTFQVSEDHSLYRSTEQGEEIGMYGEWKKLND